jgi:hypothetical protein
MTECEWSGEGTGEEWNAREGECVGSVDCEGGRCGERGLRGRKGGVCGSVSGRGSMTKCEWSGEGTRGTAR